MRENPEKRKQMLEYESNKHEERAVCSVPYKRGCMVSKNMFVFKKFPFGQDYEYHQEEHRISSRSEWKS